MNIRFLKIHKQGDQNLQLAVGHKNKKIAFTINQIRAQSLVYKKDNKYWIDIELVRGEHDAIILKMQQIKQIVTEHLFKNQLNHNNNLTVSDVEKSYKDILNTKLIDPNNDKDSSESAESLEKSRDAGKSEIFHIQVPETKTQQNSVAIISVEIHPDCQFLKTNAINIWQDSPENIEVNDLIDIIMVFTGFVFTETAFWIKYHIYKIKRHFICELDLEDIVYAKNEMPLEYDDEKYVKKYEKNFPKLT